uniref:Uncharacterized protein n=1 Tax=Arundo donax TaxID=35708 RepID=A0A0A9APR6_ARUDO
MSDNSPPSYSFWCFCCFKTVSFRERTNEKRGKNYGR